MAYEFKRISVTVDGRLATVVFNNPPMNVITLELYAEMMALTEALKADPDLTVVVFKSADPDFFLAHFDVSAILQFPTDTVPAKDDELNPFHVMCERVRTMDKVTIAQIEGRVGGGGSEFAASCDMRFGVRGKSVVNQMEVPIGILPGGTGTQRLPRLMGRGRAMEIVLGGGDLDAETGERWGYFNRVFDAVNIDGFVRDLAERIASFPAEAVRLAKRSVNAAEMPLAEGLKEEAYLFQCLLRTDGAQRNMSLFMEMGGQTREAELDVASLSARVAARANER